VTDTWLKALILVCTFGAVLLLVEVLVSAFTSSRMAGNAINLRLKMIAQGRSRDETLGLLRRRASALPSNLPEGLKRLGERFERMLIKAQVAMPTGRLMLFLLVAPIVIFFILLLVMSSLGIALGAGRLLLVATFAGALGAFLPIMFLQYKATKTRKKMEEQFPVALDVFVR